MPAQSVTLATINSALAQIYDDDITSQINRACAFLQLMPYKPGTGKNLAFDIEEGDEVNSGNDISWGEGVDITDFEDDSISPAVLSWGTSAMAFKVTGKAAAAAAVNGNPAALVDLIDEKLERRIRALTKGLNREFLTGDGSTNHVFGLCAANGPTDVAGTYATIDRGSNAQWQSNLVDFTTVQAGGGDMIDAMRLGRRDVFNRSGELPDVWLCDMFQWDKYAAAIETRNQRRMVQEVTVRGQRIVLDGGYKALDFEGVPVLPDVDMPTGTMVGLTSQHVRVRQLPDAITSMMAKRMATLHGTPDAMVGPGMTQLVARLQVLAFTGDALKMALFCYPQLECKKPNAQVRIINLPTT